jgi:hypothetical protein
MKDSNQKRDAMKRYKIKNGQLFAGVSLPVNTLRKMAVNLGIIY